MLQEISLNGTWELHDEILTCDLAEAPCLTRAADGWIPTPIPGDIHQGLIAAGRIKEPLLGLSSFDCEWTERRSWWFRKAFEVPAEWLAAEAIELVLNGLDSNAEIFVNGTHIGSHHNAFCPFVADVKHWLAPGENVLLVRLTAGIETVSEADLDAPDGIRANTEEGRGRPERGDTRRTFARKPQYSFGWDWSPRLATTAIAGDVKIRAMNEACIRHVALRPFRHSDEVVVVTTVTVDKFHHYKTAEGVVTVTLTDARSRQFRAERIALLRSGYTFIELAIPIAEPCLWWPNGLGEQHLYRVEAELTVGGERTAYPAFDYGIRFVELDTQDKFAFIVNGKQVFCKGADWIPADALYARVSDEKYETLVREARGANLNMLRVWGGGLYERDAFYRACDRYGIMLWHDFMFACAPYPDHLEWFRAEVEKEADYQTRRLQHHACIVLWCGNNENHWGFQDWWHEQTRGGAWIYNYLLPEIVRRNCPEIPYWNSSPYGGNEPNSSEVGDRHHWGDCMMNPDVNKRITPEEYDKCTSLFVSEFGYIGACGKETTLTYLDGTPLDRRSKVWQHHTNTFEKETVEAGIRKHYVASETLTFDDYLLYSGLVQGLMYSYALDSMRYRPNCHGSLFWMFEDCWGEVGWTIVDYYLRRKPSWYFVYRAFAPVRLILRAAGDDIHVVAANDTPDALALDVEYGYVSLDGSVADLHHVMAHIPALERARVCMFPRSDHDPTCGLWIARVPARSDIPTAIFRAVDYRQLQIADCELRIAICDLQFGKCSCAIHITTDMYAHAVHFMLPDGVLPLDNYFDLLPGEHRKIHLVSPQPFDPAAVGVTCVNARRLETKRYSG